MNRIRYWLRSVFGFSPKERSGFSVFTIILVLAVAAPFLFERIATYTQTPSDLATDKRIADSLMLDLEKPASSPAIVEDAPAASSQVKQFDPNLLTIEQWQALGLPSSIAQRILNYRQKGGKFRTKSDVLKIYGFPANLYSRLAPSIQLPDSLPIVRKDHGQTVITKAKETEALPSRALKTIQPFDLNLADSAQLVQIKGIGPGLSRRILNYRHKLGGFASKSQLKEVYGLDSLVAEEVLKYTFVQSSPLLQKLSVNTATYAELNAHPYISPKVASIIIDYRKQHGNYASLESLYQIRALDKATLVKLAPYLSFE
jgi:DNA uptake protein ComE-like DNA-binding protein